MKALLWLCSVIVLILCFTMYSKEKTEARGARVLDLKIRITVNNTAFTATMYDNPAAKDFISLLPLTLKLDDYAGTEKISKLPMKLSLKDAPAGSDPSVGDITYYAPWGNLALFYKDFGYSEGLVLLGKIDSSADFFKKCGGSCTVKIEKTATGK